MFSEQRDQLVQSWNQEQFISLYQSLLMCEIVDPSTSRLSQLACTSKMETNYYKSHKEIHTRVHEGQVEGLKI